MIFSDSLNLRTYFKRIHVTLFSKQNVISVMIWVCLSLLFNSVRTIVRQRQVYDGPEDEAMVSKRLVLVFSAWQLHNIGI